MTAATADKKTATETFAIIETGGKQYQVAQGDVINIEKLPGTEEGSKVTFDKVLLVDNGKDTQIGDPYLKGAKVEATLEREIRGDKIEILKFKSKSNYMKRQGHRQTYSEVKITSIK